MIVYSYIVFYTIVYSYIVFYTIQLTVVLTKPQKYLYMFQ